MKNKSKSRKANHTAEITNQVEKTTYMEVKDLGTPELNFRLQLLKGQIETVARSLADLADQTKSQRELLNTLLVKERTLDTLIATRR